MEIKIKVRKYFTLHNSQANLKKKNYHPPNCKLCTKTRKTKQTRLSKSNKKMLLN